MPRIIVTLVFLIFALSIAGHIHAQDISKTTIALELKNATLAEAFAKIESVTAFRFTYKTADVANIKGITYNQKKVTIKKVLTDLLSNTSLEYEQARQYILVK